MGDVFVPMYLYMAYKDGVPINKARDACRIPEGIPIECNPIPCAVCGGMPSFIVKEKQVGKHMEYWHYVQHKCDVGSIKIKLCPFIIDAIKIMRVGRSGSSAIAITKWNACQRYIEKLAKRIVQEPYRQQTRMQVYLIRGIPGSGKTTHAKRVLHSDVVIEDDDFFTRNGVYKFVEAELPEAQAFALKRFSLAIADRRNRDKTISVCNTFSRRWEIAPYIEACKKAGVEFSVIRMDGTFENVHDIPEYKVHNMSRSIENVDGEVVQIPVRL